MCLRLNDLHGELKASLASETLSQKNRHRDLKKPAEPIKEILALGEMSLFSYSYQNPEKLKNDNSPNF